MWYTATEDPPLVQEHVCRKPQCSGNSNAPHVQHLHMGLWLSIHHSHSVHPNGSDAWLPHWQTKGLLW